MSKLISVDLCLCLSSTCTAGLITLDDNAPADFTTIQAAINDANNGHTVEVQPGTYTGESNRDIDLLGKAITLRGNDGPGDGVINCQGPPSHPRRAFVFHNSEGPNSAANAFPQKPATSPESGI